MLDAASGPTRRRKRLPTWAVVLIVLCALALLTAVVLVVRAQLVSPNEANVSPLNSTVREGVVAIQTGVEAWAGEHAGTYPDADLVTQNGLAAYVSDWPTSPFTDEPMKQGTQSGDFSYTVSPDGASYQLIGYGDERNEVITLP